MESRDNMKFQEEEKADGGESQLQNPNAVQQDDFFYKIKELSKEK